jgi:hypothetical protein
MGIMISDRGYVRAESMVQDAMYALRHTKLGFHTKYTFFKLDTRTRAGP